MLIGIIIKDSTDEDIIANLLYNYRTILTDKMERDQVMITMEKNVFIWL